MIDKETCHLRARELDAGASSSKLEASERSTIEGTEIVVGTTEDFPTIEVTGSRKSDPPA